MLTFYMKKVVLKTILMVGKERLELSQYCYYWILSPTRLPVPPFAHIFKFMYLDNSIKKDLI